MTAGPVLQLDDLRVVFATPHGVVEAVRGLSLRLLAGECLGIIGESGSGKSQAFLAVSGLLAHNGMASGSAKLDGRELIGRASRKLRSIRGTKIGLVFQDPSTALTPHMRIGDQLMEALSQSGVSTSADRRSRALAWLQRVRIADAARRLDQYPHELSGGMRQRVMIAIAMACEPRLLIADEPTTALDATVQADILDLLDELRRETGTAIILITHDMGVAARLADQICVMRNGETVESGAVEHIFHAPTSDYTRALLAAVPRLDRADRGDRQAIGQVPAGARVVLQVNDLKVHYPVRRGWFGRLRTLRAVDGLTFSVRESETIGIVGESGSGKSTLARAILKLVPTTAGSVSLIGTDLGRLDERALRAARRDLQLVFQDPLASLDPRSTISASIAEPLQVYRPGMKRAERDQHVQLAMSRVGLDPPLINRYPHELSGGQNQRVAIARSIILSPKLIICDEPVSALDVSIRAQIIDLLIMLQRETGMAMVFISHDMATVREISHRILVLYLGRVMELADRDRLCDGALHPYTKALLSAVPIPDPAQERGRKRVKLEGEPPSPFDPLAQLRFLPTRLRAAKREGGVDFAPTLAEVSPGHFVAEFEAEPGT